MPLAYSKATFFGCSKMLSRCYMNRVNQIGTREQQTVGGKSGGVAAPMTDAVGNNHLTPWEIKLQAKTERLLLTWGGYESVRRFMRKISKVATRFAYLSHAEPVHVAMIRFVRVDN